MAKKVLPIFIRDSQTGLLKEFPEDEASSLLPAPTGNCPEALRILVADDNESDRLLTIRHLGSAWPVEREIVVECAADGAEALEKIRQKKFGLVVMDHNMPYQDGTAVLRAIRAEGLFLPVVMVSDQDHQVMADELATMAATFVSKQNLNAINLGSAIVESIYLQAARRDVA